MLRTRRLKLKSLYNARDLGGYAVPGGRTKFGVFLRSDVPSGLPECDIQALKDYGVTMCLDFRSGPEMTRDSIISDYITLDWVQYRHIPTYSEDGFRTTHEKYWVNDMAPEHGPYPWIFGYNRIVDYGKKWIKECVEAAAECDGVLQFHCSSGKDRTGMCSAILLAIAGVSKYDIAADYCMSQALLDRKYAQTRPNYRIDDRYLNAGDKFILTSPVNMLSVMDHIEKDLGGIDAYLNSCGVSGATIQKIRDKFVEKFDDNGDIRAKYVRKMQMDSMNNARDLGGYPVDGGRTKFGVFLRTDLPYNLTDRDVEALKSYGVKTSLDFRSEPEKSGEIPELHFKGKPSDCEKMDWVEYCHIPTYTPDGLKTGHKYYFATEVDEPGFTWGDAYIRILRDGGDWVRQCVEKAAESDGIMQFNCSSGKDRTGIFAAILLAIAGVEKWDIVADYCVSQSYLEPSFEKKFPDFSTEDRSKNTSIRFAFTDPNNMFAAMDYIENEFGGIDAYLTGRCGVKPEVIEKIREKFIEKE